MKNRFLPTIACFCVAVFLVYGVAPVRAANHAAVTARVADDIRYLTSDELEGRGAGSAGLQKAAEFIRDEFRKYGLESGVADGSYFQPFEFALETRDVPEETSLVLRGPGGQTLQMELGKDFQSLAVGGAGQVQAEIVFAGYGISAPMLEYDDFKDFDVEGKVIVIIRREPQQDSEKSAFDGKKVTPHSYIQTKLQLAKKVKAAAVLFVNDPFTTRDKEDELTPVAGFGSGSSGVPFAHITMETFNKMLAATPLKSSAGESLASLDAIEKAIDDTYQPISQPLSGWSADLAFAFAEVKAPVVNVVGVIPGEGPLADETIVIGAHYDHLGFGPFGSRRPNEKALHPGADDNATGTAAILELARRFGERGKKPARRLVFIGFSAEERGLIGSNYYISNPLFPLNDTVAMINFDMIGRLRDNKLIVNGARSGKEFPDLLDQANLDEALQVDKGQNLMGGDHFGFYQKKIPAVHFFTGLTDDYHTPDDTFERINVDGVVTTIDYCERFLDGVVKMPARPEYVQVARGGGGGRGGMAYLGVTPNYAGDGNGLEITGINEDSPAEKGGLKPGDVIIKFGEIPVADIQGLADGLRANRPGETVKVVVRRGDMEKTLSVVLERPQGGN